MAIVARWLLGSIALPLAASAATAPVAGPVAIADHIAVHARDPAVSAAFYKSAFGMTDVPTRLPNTRWLRMGPTMTLHIIGGRTEKVQQELMIHFALRADDLAQSIAYFDAQGIAWTDFTGKPRAIQTRFDGVRQIFVQDPDGYWIEVSDARGTSAP